MIDRVKRIAMVLILGCLLLGTVVHASDGTQINVFFKEITYMIDGIEKTNGTESALIYKGTTYVPIRFIGEALGKTVEWNGETNTVWIGKREEGFDYLTDIAYARADGAARTNSYFDNVLTIAGKVYENKGVKVNLPVTDSQSNHGSIDYNLEGRYTRITGMTGINDTTKNSDATGTLIIRGDGKELASFANLKGGDLPRNVEVDVTGVSKLRLVFESDNVDRLTIDFVAIKLFY